MGSSLSCSECNKSKTEPDYDFTISKNILAEACEGIRSQSLEQTPNSDNRLCYASLTVSSSQNLTVGATYDLNPLGFEFSKREFKDGIVYFGDFRRERLEDGSKGEILNDILLRNEKKTEGKHFMIGYNWDCNFYFVQDLGVGLGVFRKLHCPIGIKANMLVCCSNLFLLFDFQGQDLRINLFSKNFQQVYVFHELQYMFKNATIGRGGNCDICVEDLSISKVQISILRRYNEWILIDGNSSTRKVSKNGSWVYIKDKFRVLNGMKLKTGDTIFDVKVFNKS